MRQLSDCVSVGCWWRRIPHVGGIAFVPNGSIPFQRVRPRGSDGRIEEATEAAHSYHAAIPSLRDCLAF